MAKEFTLGWLHSDHVALNEINPGEGKIVQSGLHKIAAYRDTAGKLHACSAVCTHMKSIVKWNPVECTWDCPSHGARFDKDGHVLEGPAVRLLNSHSLRRDVTNTYLFSFATWKIF